MNIERASLKLVNHENQFDGQSDRLARKALVELRESDREESLVLLSDFSTQKMSKRVTLNLLRHSFFEPK